MIVLYKEWEGLPVYTDPEEGITLRFCSESDLPRLVELERICFCDPWSAGMLADELESPNGVMVVLERESCVFGYAGMWLWDQIGEAHVSNIALEPERRGYGYGSMMIFALFMLASAFGVALMTLEVRKGNVSAQKAYERNGFVAAGIRPHYYANGEDALIMWNYNIPATLQKRGEADAKYAKMYRYMYKSLQGLSQA